MGLSEVGSGPLRGMIGMRVIEARDAQSTAPRLTFDFDELRWRYAVAIVRRICACVAGPLRSFNAPAVRRFFAEQCTAAFVRISLLAMSANILIDRRRNAQNAHASSQKRSLMYLSAESGSTVTITAERPADASSRAISRLAATAAAAEMPTSKPSSRASRLAIA